MPLLRFEISDASDSGRGSAPAASHSRFAYARRSALIVGLVLLFVNGSTTASGAEANAPAAEKLELLTDFFENEVATGRLPGAVVLIQQHGHPVYLKTFGVRDVGTNLPMTLDTMFALHSMTKPITSLAAMMLVDAGKLSLDDPVAKYIPSFADVKVGVRGSMRRARHRSNLSRPSGCRPSGICSCKPRGLPPTMSGPG